MIQRIQTVYLLLAALASLACLMMPVGSYTLISDSARVATEYNLWLAFADGSHSMAPWPLFAVLVVETALTVYAIFAYHNRIAQARLCAFAALLVVGWGILYAVEALAVGCGVQGARFAPTWQAALPVAAFVLTLLARRAVLADERLVRAADRIR